MFFALLLWTSKPHVSPNLCWILFLLHEPVVGSKAPAKIRTVRGKDGSGVCRFLNGGNGFLNKMEGFPWFFVVDQWDKCPLKHATPRPS